MVDHGDKKRDPRPAVDGADIIERDTNAAGELGHQPTYGASAGSVTGVEFAAEAAALGIDSGPLRRPVDVEAIDEAFDEESAAEPY